MPYSDNAMDWYVTGIGTVGGTAGVGAAGGAWIFGFESIKARYKCLFIFGGIGVGVGARSNSNSLYGEAIRALDRASTNVGLGFPGERPTELTGQLVPFSAAELDGAGGLVWDGGVAIGGGYSLTSITAFRLGVNYFVGQPSFSRAIGIGASVVLCSGSWQHVVGRNM